MWAIALAMLPFGVAAIIWARGVSAASIVRADAAATRAEAAIEAAESIAWVHAAQARLMDAEARAGFDDDASETVH